MTVENLIDINVESSKSGESVQADQTDTLLECLMLLCQLNGVAMTKDALVSGLPLRDGVLTPNLFKRASERANLVSKVIKKPLSEIQSELLPAVLLLKGEVACLLLGWDSARQNARVIFPELGETEVSIAAAELAERYAGHTLTAKLKFVFDQRTPSVGKVRNRHWFWGTLADNSRIYGDVMVAAFLINMFALAMPIFTMNVYDRVVPNRSIETLWVMVAGIALIIIGDLVLRTMRGYFLDWASHRIDNKLSANIMEQVLGTRLEEKPISVGSFASSLRSFETVRDFITSATITTFIDIPFALIFIIAMAWISLPMIVPVLVGAVIILVYSFSVQTKMHDLSETMYRAGAVRNATLIESLVGLETVKALGVEGQMQRKWEKSAAFLTEVSGKLKLLSTSITNTAGAITQLINISLILLGVYLVIKGDLSMGGLIACTMLAGRALTPISQAAGLMTQYHNASTSLTALNDMMANPIERPVDANFLSRTSFKGDIEFREVSFNYPGSDVDALVKVSFKIKAGEHVALLGKMGSGKSTIHRLILGLYQPTSGAILIDGIDTRQIDPAELRRSVGYVQQDTQLFYGSMRENISISNQYVSSQDILEAAQTGGIDGFINTHPKGFDMLVGERGETLSGGQRQGVGIARAMINKPSIFLLDEPTSAMDHSGEDAIKKRLAGAMQDKTLVLISHRTSLFDLAQRIIVVDSGRIVADGEKEKIIEALRAGKIGKSAMSEWLFRWLGKLQAKFVKRNWLTQPIYRLLEKIVPNKTSEDLPWEEEADLLLIEQSPRRAKKLLYGIAIIMGTLLIWAYFAEVDEVTRGEGRVIPSKQVQIIQSLDGGIVSAILVKEGDTVVSGTPLVSIDETRAVSSLRENQSQYLSLLAKQSRLEALATGGSFSPPAEVQKEAPEVYSQEYALYQSSKDELASSVSISRDQMEQREKELVEAQFKKELAEKTYESSAKELAANKPLLASGAVSEIDILKLEREVTRARGEIDQARAQMSRIQVSISEARRKISEVEQNFRSKVRTELTETSAKLNALTESSVALSDKVKQATLKSPVNGKVSRIFYNTVGGVIQPGKEVMEIVPTDDALVIETKIEIKDIAFLRPNQPAVVKLTAYDYTIYGTLDAVLDSISADSTVDEKGNAYYLVRVRTIKSNLGKGLPIIPGMVAQVDILTGKKTILSYLLKPVLKAKARAFTER